MLLLLLLLVSSSLNSYILPHRFRTSDYPFLCMAYRIPHGLPVTAVVQIKGYGWRSVAMTTTQQLYYPAVGHWDDGMNADSIVDDDK